MPKTATPRKPETVSRKLAETRAKSKNRSLSSLLGIGDNEKRLATDLGSGLNDVIGRGTIAGLLGLPGDLGGAAENGLRSLLGLPQVVPYGGSEHIGQKLEQAGLVSDVRRPKTELLASLISPAQAATAGYKAPQMARAGVKALDNLSAPSTLAMANKPASQRGIFAGINARNAPKDALEQGAKLLDEGADPRQVWKDLGVFRGADGKMRWEIDDSGAKVISEADMRATADAEKASLSQRRDGNKQLWAGLKQQPDLFQRELKSELKTSNAEIADGLSRLERMYGPYTNTYLGNHAPLVYQHDQIYNAYPELGKVVVERGKRGVSYDAMFSGDVARGNARVTATSGADLDTVLPHEFQHAIQDSEGFSRGGNPDLFMGDGYAGYSAKDGTPFSLYRRLAGEAEARAVEARRKMTQAERRAVYPFDSYDVPVNELIHANGNGVAMSVGNLGKMVVPQDEALRVAQANAAKPVSEGGLGLRPDNTPEERAAAMGFTVDAYRGDQPLHSFYPNSYSADNPDIASRYAEINDMGMVYPLKVNTQNILDTRTDIGNESAMNMGITRRMSNNLPHWSDVRGADLTGHSGMVLSEMSFDPAIDRSASYMIKDPSNIRSRFAAFDPMRRDSSDLLAGLAPFGAVPWLRDEEP